MTNGCIGIKRRKIIMIPCIQCDNLVCSYIGHIDYNYPNISKDMLHYLAYRYKKDVLFEYSPLVDSNSSFVSQKAIRKIKQLSPEEERKIHYRLKYIDNTHLNRWSIQFLFDIFILEDPRYKRDGKHSSILQENALKKMKKSFPYLAKEIDDKIRYIKNHSDHTYRKQDILQFKNSKLINKHIIHDPSFIGIGMRYDGPSYRFKTMLGKKEKDILLDPSIYKEGEIVISIAPAFKRSGIEHDIDGKIWGDECFDRDTVNLHYVTFLDHESDDDDMYFKSFHIDEIVNNKEKFPYLFDVR